MKKTILYILLGAALLVGVAVVSAHEVSHIDGDKIGGNSVQDVQPTKTVEEAEAPNSDSPKEQAPIQANREQVSEPRDAGISTTRESSDSGSCEKAQDNAASAGWKILSCDPLRVMPLDEWNMKSANSNFRYQPGLYCFDESNFANMFAEQTGEPDSTGYYPDMLSEMKLENGCSFFFHPNQGHGNGAPDERDLP